VILAEIGRNVAAEHFGGHSMATAHEPVVSVADAWQGRRNSTHRPREGSRSTIATLDPDAAAKEVT
jgi:hypothetical protein